MKLEFQRYRLSQFRILTGILQIAGSTGLLLGYVYRPFILIASLGLGVLMLLGVSVRVKIRDPWYMIVPAFTYAVLNFSIFFHALESVK